MRPLCVVVVAVLLSACSFLPSLGPESCGQVKAADCDVALDLALEIAQRDRGDLQAFSVDRHTEAECMVLQPDGSGTVFYPCVGAAFPWAVTVTLVFRDGVREEIPLVRKRNGGPIIPMPCCLL